MYITIDGNHRNETIDPWIVGTRLSAYFYIPYTTCSNLRVKQCFIL